MSGKAHIWTDATVAKAIEISRSADSVEDAASQISDHIGRDLSRNAIEDAFRRLGKGTIYDHVRAGLRRRRLAAKGSPPPDERHDTERGFTPPSTEDIEAFAERESKATLEDRASEPAEDEEPETHPLEAREEREEVQRYKRQVARLVEELRLARMRQAFLDEAVRFHAPPSILPRERTSGLREITPVVLASDWHVEETVEPESIAHRNSYNLDIADARIKRFFNAIVWNVEHHRASKRVAIHDMVLWAGGDLITGYLHEELVESNALSPTETVRWLLPRLRDGIHTLRSALDIEVVVPCSFGNHGRSTIKPRISTGYANSFEWLMYHALADSLCDDKGVRFEITNSSHQYVDVYGRTLHFHHGDDVKYQGGVGGVGIPLLKAVPMWDLVRKAEVHNIGHFHTLLDYGRAVVNGSLIGYGPYSQRIRAAFESPQQAMYFVDSKRGKCMTTALWVGDAEAEAAGPAAVDS
jgi:hypothetical protein